MGSPAIAAWIAQLAFWGLIAFDSAVTHRRTVEAVKRAEDSDPYLEMYEGPIEGPPSGPVLTRNVSERRVSPVHAVMPNNARALSPRNGRR